MQIHSKDRDTDSKQLHEFTSGSFDGAYQDNEKKQNENQTPHSESAEPTAKKAWRNNIEPKEPIIEVLDDDGHTSYLPT